ncbi:hypothetical protein QFZ79_002891 [Arthrobacter sp. V4I6]|uniref:phage tail tube protein n=1 Tax=Arthrobacter sp. V4I6 TaxID=3042281 RepID=UPI00278B0D5F|nr:hypothetical protein [Arthrobacter sp. V4I6]MDQ0854780.1 hypothetical protein [Arthrobacter sp. V4I6]
MPITPGLVSDWTLEVAAYTTGAEPTTYTRVYGITNYTPPGVSKSLEDDSDFDSGAWGSQTATGLDYEISGTVKVPVATATADPGQAILRAAGKGVGEDGYVHFRTVKKDGATGHKGLADASFTEGGGARTDLTTAEFTLAGRGALADYTPA